MATAGRTTPDTGALDEGVLRVLRCPACRDGELGAVGSAGLVCARCGSVYALEDGVPVLVASGAGDRAADEHKSRQASFFDRAHEGGSEEYETTRPRGTPPFHRWLIAEKLRRSVAGLGSLGGRSALVVCGGSGMDGEFLARAGARVVTSDLSAGAARRALERSRRFAVPLVSIVADAERLPFADRAIDLVYVHDGLHHLEDPLEGLAEMARVAAWAVSVTEPARAAATALAVRTGVALEREEAGNRVARLQLDEVTRALRASGFRIERAGRYAMFYRHEAGPVARLLSRPVLLPLARRGFLALDAVAGRGGNKLTVQAVREAP